jgi:hypothetical protein
MNLKHSVALLAVSASLIAAPAAMANGSGNGNSSLPGNPTAGGGPANSAGFGAGGASGTSGVNGGGGGAGGAASGNSSNNPPATCTISTFNTTVSVDPANGLTAARTAVAIPAGCPGRSSFSVQYINQVTGAVEYTYFNSTGLATSGSANATTPGTSTTVAVDGLAWATAYTVHIEIDSGTGQLITQLNQSVVMPANPS